jgi:hypothetical protein
MVMACLYTKFHIPNYYGSLMIAVKLKVKSGFHATTILF